VAPGIRYQSVAGYKGTQEDTGGTGGTREVTTHAGFGTVRPTRFKSRAPDQSFGPLTGRDRETFGS